MYNLIDLAEMNQLFRKLWANDAKDTDQLVNKVNCYLSLLVSRASARETSDSGKTRFDWLDL